MNYPPERHAEAAEGLLELARAELTGWWRRRRRAEAIHTAQVHATLATLASSTSATRPTYTHRQETVPVPDPFPARPPRPRHAAVAEPDWSDPTLPDHLAGLDARTILAGDPAELLAPPPMVPGPGGPVPLFQWLRQLHPNAAGATGGPDHATNVLGEAVGAMYLAAAGAVVTVESGAQVPLASYFAGVDLEPGGELQQHFIRGLAGVAYRGVYRRDVLRLDTAHQHVIGKTTDGQPWPITPAVFDAVVGVLAGELASREVPAPTLGQLGTALLPVRTVMCQAPPA